MKDKMLKTYANLSTPVKASIWFTVCNILQKGMAFLTTPIFTRLLSTEEFGKYSVYISWYSILTVFFTLNLAGGVYNKGLIKYAGERDKLTSSFIGLSNFTVCIFFLVYILRMDFWNSILGLSSILVFAMFIQALVEPSFQLWTVAERFDYKYRKIVIATIFLSIVSPIAEIIAVRCFKDKVIARVLTAVLCEFIICIGIYISSIKKGKCLYNKQFWHYGLMFNLPLIPHYLSMTVLNQADRIMISNLIGSHEAAIYSVAYSVAMCMTVVTNAISNTYIPYSYKALRDNNIEGIKKNTNILLFAIGVGCLLAMLFGPEIIRIVAPSSYYDAIWVMPPISISIYFMFLYNLFGNIEFYYEKTKFVMIASCVGAIANIILNYIFIPMFGYYAAGYTTLVCYIIYAIMHYIFYKYIIKNYADNQYVYNMKVIILISIIMIILMFVVTILYNFTFWRYVLSAIFVVLLILTYKKINKLHL